MLKTYGNIYLTGLDELNELESVLTEAGFQIAIRPESPLIGIIIKEVEEDQ